MSGGSHPPSARVGQAAVTSRASAMALRTTAAMVSPAALAFLRPLLMAQPPARIAQSITRDLNCKGGAYTASTREGEPKLTRPVAPPQLCVEMWHQESVGPDQ